jgi:hypothetical protein
VLPWSNRNEGGGSGWLNFWHPVHHSKTFFTQCPSRPSLHFFSQRFRHGFLICNQVLNNQVKVELSRKILVNRKVIEPEAILVKMQPAVAAGSVRYFDCNNRESSGTLFVGRAAPIGQGRCLHSGICLCIYKTGRAPLKSGYYVRGH